MWKSCAVLQRVPPALRRTAIVAALLVAASGLTSCGGAATSGMSDSAATGQSQGMVAAGNTLNQPVPKGAAATKLVDQDGQPFTLQSLRGRTVVVAPMLTYCQETCPMTSANMHQAAADARAAGLGQKVLFLEVTVDPDRDSVKRLHAYAKLYGALPNWRLATGDPAAVKAFWKDIGVITDKAPTDEAVHDWLTGKLVRHNYDVHHQDLVVIIDPAGRLRWITVGRPDARATRLPTTMQQFLNEEGKRNLDHPTAGGASSWTARNVEQAVHYVLQNSSTS
jgi:cytochrome oxidase Cu insertion factor (SCO1/SenC/PrrC family)